MARKQAPGKAPSIRWLVLPLGFGLVALAGYALLTAKPRPEKPPADTPRPAVSAPDGSDRIGEASREELRQILREADEQ